MNGSDARMIMQDRVARVSGMCQDSLGKLGAQGELEATIQGGRGRAGRRAGGEDPRGFVGKDRVVRRKITVNTKQRRASYTETATLGDLVSVKYAVRATGGGARIINPAAAGSRRSSRRMVRPRCRAAGAGRRTSGGSRHRGTTAGGCNACCLGDATAAGKTRAALRAAIAAEDTGAHAGHDGRHRVQ